MAISVPAYRLQIGDMFTADYAIITDVFEDDDGVWFETDAGDSGYTLTRETIYQIERD